MTESGNNPVEAATNQPLAIDVRKAIGQHLQALAKSGMETVQHGTGRFEFLLVNQDGPPARSQSAMEIRERSTVSYVEAQSESDSPGGTTKPAPSDIVSDDSPVHAKPVTGRDDDETPVAQPISATNAGATSIRSGVTTVVNDSEAYGPSLSLPQRKSALDVLRTEVAGCTRCSELVANRTQTVFGVGNITPRLVFVGEGPGADEDKLGEPFVGAAGQLLNKIMAASKINREDVYILNTVKCRPPANRNPSQTELDHCWGYAQAQLEILQPEFICCLGSVAAKRLLNTNQSLGRLRQRFHVYRGSRVMVTYHPAYLLRTESAKRHVWEDMKMLIREMGVDPAGS